MLSNDEVRMLHILDAAREALSFVRDRKREDLNNDRMLLLALVKEIEIIGEAATRVSEPTQTETPDIPWQHITGMRNRLVHAYFNININIVWQTVQEDLPPLIAILERILPPQSHPSNPYYA